MKLLVLVVFTIIFGITGVSLGGYLGYKLYTETPAPTTFEEPARTAFMFMCIGQYGFSVTSCLCQEDAIIKNRNDKTLDNNRINAIIKDCGAPISAPSDADPFIKG
jgi:hypothetical protein